MEVTRRLLLSCTTAAGTTLVGPGIPTTTQETLQETLPLPPSTVTQTINHPTPPTSTLQATPQVSSEILTPTTITTTTTTTATAQEPLQTFPTASTPPPPVTHPTTGTATPGFLWLCVMAQ